jgi:peptide/nickel transport system substrate-binding protein
LVLSACGGDDNGGDGGDAGDQPTDSGESTAVTVGWNQPFYSYNNNTSYGNATANANILYMTQTPFGYYNNNAELVQNTDFGTVELDNEEPTEVTYTINEGVAWSDGTPVDAADLLLAWAGISAQLNAEDFEPEYDDAGQIIPGSGAEVYFDGGDSCLAGTSVTAGDDGRSMTIAWEEQYVDWAQCFWNGAGVAVPAHVVAKNALEIEDPTEAKQAVVDAVLNNDAAALAPLANDWNTGFNFESLPDDPDRYLSFGAYVITDFEENQFITLEKNEDYTWGPEPKADEVTVRFIPDAMAAVQALENGEVDMIQPQSTADVLSALEGMSGVVVENVAESTYEHVDLNVGNSRTEGIWDDPMVREAFLKTIPRQRIVDDLIKPLNPEAEVLNSQLLLSDFEGYDQMAAENGSDAYTDVDIEGAQQLLADAGVENLEPCVLYDSNNPRRVNEFRLMQESAEQAGITLADCGDPGWGGMLGQPNIYDVALFGWQKTNTGVSESEANYVEGGINNFYNYQNEEVEQLFSQLSQTTDPAEQLDIQIQIEQQLWGDGFGVTLFQFPGVSAFSEQVANASSAPLSPTIFWNFWEWEVVS